MSNVNTNVNTRVRSKQKSFYNKLYSKSRHCFQHDIFVNFPNKARPSAASKIPPYYHIFININTRYACAFPVWSKSAKDAVKTITSFIKKHKCRKLISDAESAFRSESVLSLLSRLNIDIQINDEQNHKTLAIVDRFIRTIRDKHGENTPIPIDKMNNIINVYNSTVHSSTGFTPLEMQQDKRLEIKYIYDCIKKQHGIENTPDYRINIGDYVRLLKTEYTMRKKRRTLTKHYYIVTETALNRIVVSAADGSTKTVSRSDCVVINKNTPLTQANTIGNGNRGIITKIIHYNPKKQIYTVLYEGSTEPWTVSVRDMRAKFPNRITDMEFEYFKNRGIKIHI